MPALLVSVDVEASGPAPGHGDMISFACVPITPKLDLPRFHSGNIKPDSHVYDPGAYQAIGMTRLEHMQAETSMTVAMLRFEEYCTNLLEEAKVPRLVMLSDNPGFDFQWINYESFNHLSYNPFGHSARRIGDVWSGLKNGYYETQGWKKLRVAPHDHNPLNDALGNAEAWLAMWRKYGSEKTLKEIS